MTTPPKDWETPNPHKPKRYRVLQGSTVNEGQLFRLAQLLADIDGDFENFRKVESAISYLRYKKNYYVEEVDDV